MTSVPLDPMAPHHLPSVRSGKQRLEAAATMARLPALRDVVRSCGPRRRSMQIADCGLRIADSAALVAPLQVGWNGAAGKKPWDRRVTACVPHLETLEALGACVETLRWQSERPYIVVVDTGSSAATRAGLEAMRASDLEVHYIAAHAYRHASEPVCVALDLAQALCRTEFIFHTHADCFLRRRNFLEETVAKCGEGNPVIGYRMSPREWATDEWEWMVGHTATVMHMPTIQRIGGMWSMGRMHTQYGYAWTSGCGGWPDTETGFNCILRDAGIKPEFIGDDVNGQRQVDENIDHVRSYAGSKIYSAEYHSRASGWMRLALSEAKMRVRTR
jgi:hypothetical protein